MAATSRDIMTPLLCLVRSPSPGESKSISEILERVHNDHRFDGIISFDDDADRFVKLIEKEASLVAKYLSLWDVQENDEDVEEKLLDLYKVCILLYGATQRRNKQPKFDFFFDAWADFHPSCIRALPMFDITSKRETFEESFCDCFGILYRCKQT